jgi:hypothetical protein
VAFLRSVLTDLRAVGGFVPVASYQRVAYACGALLMLSGLAHLGVYLVDGGPWAGPVSWRKPVVFGLSFGLALVTLSWVMGLLRPPRAAGWMVLGTLTFCSVGEVALISMQRWRGVPSHFNESTPFDAAVFSMMGALVTVLAVAVVVITVWSFIRIAAPSSLALAVRAGLVLMLVSQAVGAQMITEGGNTFGAAGALKMPHAVTLHAVQVLPALALLLLAGDAAERQRVRVVAVATAGYGLLLASTLVQTYAGRPPLDLDLVPTLLAAGGLAILAGSAVVALRRLRGRSARDARTAPRASSAPRHRGGSGGDERSHAGGSAGSAPRRGPRRGTAQPSPPGSPPARTPHPPR